MRGLRRIRRSRGWSQTRLAAEVGVSVRTIHRWERGGQYPGSILDILACVLDCRPEDLVAAKPIIRAPEPEPATTAPTLPPQKRKEIQ